MTIVDTIHDAHYGSRAGLAMELARLINEEARELEALGLDMLQLDEPAFNVYMDEVRDWGVAALDRAVEGLRCRTAVHICYGYGIKARHRLEADPGRRVAAVRTDLPAPRPEPGRRGLARVRRLAGAHLPDRPARRQRRPGRRGRRGHRPRRDARGGGRGDPLRDAARAPLPHLPLHQLRDGAALARGGARQAAGPRRRGRDRAGRARRLTSRPMTQEMTAYYARRAAEYERVCTSPRWQDDLAVLRPRVADVFAGRRGFEIACGTGYWTHVAAERARAVHATDVNDDTLALAPAKTYAAPVSFERRDAYAPADTPERFDAGLAGLWLSHLTHLGQHTPWSPVMDAWSSEPIPEAALAGRTALQRRGAVVFQAKQCRDCHALGGRGGMRGPALDDVAVTLTQDQLVRQVIRGEGTCRPTGRISALPRPPPWSPFSRRCTRPGRRRRGIPRCLPFSAPSARDARVKDARRLHRQPAPDRRTRSPLVGPGPRAGQLLRRWRVAAFVTGLGLAWLTVLPPLASLDHAVLTAHMLKHLILMTLAAPLLLLGEPISRLGSDPDPRVPPSSARRTLARLTAHPVGCWLAGTVTVLFWHVPVVPASAMHSPWVHFGQTVSFLVAGLLFWRPVIQPWAARAHPSAWAVPLYLILATLPCDALSAFLAFCGRPLYAAALAPAPAEQLLADQQRAGALMWVWVTLLYLVPAVWQVLRQLTPMLTAQRPPRRSVMTTTQPLTLVATGLGLFMIFLDTQIVNVALPSVQAHAAGKPRRWSRRRLAGTDASARPLCAGSAPYFQSEGDGAGHLPCCKSSPQEILEKQPWRRRESKPCWRRIFGEHVRAEPATAPGCWPRSAHEHAFGRSACSGEVAVPGEADSVGMALEEVAARWRARRSPEQLRQSLLKLLLRMERIGLPRPRGATRDDE